MTYKTEFLQAIANSETLGVKEPIQGCIDTSKEYLDSSTKATIESLFQRHILSSPEAVKYLIGGCMRINSLFKPVLEDFFKEEIILTTGYTKWLGKEIFTTPLSEFRDAALNNKPRLNWNTHTWLTLPSLEVIDVTFFHSMNYVYPGAEKILPPIKMDKNPYGSSDRIVELHPLMAGEEVLHKIGVVVYTETFDDHDLTIQGQLEEITRALKSASVSFD